MEKHFKTPKGTELPLMNLRGKLYLQVAHRIMWFLEEKPNWVISTKIVELKDKFVIMSATIIDESGVARATAHKCAGFQENDLEKCETGAIGRALAFLGYGTQFALDELEEKEKLADAPLEIKSPNKGTLDAPKAQSKPKPENHAPQSPNGISEPQAKRLYAIAMTKGYNKDTLMDACSHFLGTEIHGLTQIPRSKYQDLVSSIEQKPVEPADFSDDEMPF